MAESDTETKAEESKLAKIFQTFNLDHQAMSELYESSRDDNRNFGEEWISVRKSLREKGYDVLEGMSYDCGVPTNVILGGIPGQVEFHKAAFGRLIKPYGFPFISGEAYTEMP